MRRVVVLGSVGAGKTTLARAISARTGLPVVYLDHFFWRPGWALAPREEAARELEEAIARDEWILDGNFLEDGRRRFDRADTVVFLDVPRLTCLRRVTGRIARWRGRSRPDLPADCEEGFSRSLLLWIWSYPRTERPRVLQLLSRLDADVAVHHLRSRADVQRFLAGLPRR